MRESPIRHTHPNRELVLPLGVMYCELQDCVLVAMERWTRCSTWRIHLANYGNDELGCMGRRGIGVLRAGSRPDGRDSDVQSRTDMELVTTLRRDEALVLSADQRKQSARACWDALPAVIKDTFTNAPKVAMYEALRRMDVDAQPSRSVEWAYATRKDSLVVTVWHDQIRADLGPELLYYIPTGAWGKIAGLTGRAEQMGKELRRFSGQQVSALLLQHEWDKNGTPTAKRAAPDIKRWIVEQVTEDEFILWRGRRSTTL